MNETAFNQSLNKAKSLLKKFDLLKSTGVKKIYKDGVSDNFKKASQKEDYFKLFTTALDNFDFDIMMYDESIFQFSYKKNTKSPIPHIRFAFFPNPKLFIPYTDFLKILQEDGLIDEDQNLEELGSLYEEEYDQYLIEQQLNTGNTSIRFDVDEPRYTPLIHSVAHFHFGHITNIRIPSKRIITPLGFVIFILKHIYYQEWRKLILAKDNRIMTELINQKNSFPALTSFKIKCWDKIEENELFLT